VFKSRQFTAFEESNRFQRRHLHVSESIRAGTRNAVKQIGGVINLFSHLSFSHCLKRGPSSLAVSIDKPVMIPSYSTSARPPRIRSEPSILSNAWNSISPLITIQLVQKCVIAFVAALVLSLLVKLAIPKFALPLARNSADYLRGKTTNAFKTIQGQIRRLKDSIAKRKQISSPGIPMPFEGDDGWGKSSFRSRKFVGKSAYIQYDFDLPDSEYTLPLQLGQKLTLCSLDENNRVQKGDFYVSSPRANKGSFSLVAPLEDMEEQIGKSNAKFVSIFQRHHGYIGNTDSQRETFLCLTLNRWPC